MHSRQKIYTPAPRTLARLVLAMLVGFAALATGAQSGVARPGRDQPPPVTPEPDGPPYRIFLPEVYNHVIPPMTIFGVETNHITPSRVEQMDQANIYWMRHATFSWADIEPVRTTPPTYHWEVVDEAGLIEAASKQFAVIATVKDTPAWAQMYRNKYCGPPTPEAMDEFAEFVGAVVLRYGQRPYHIKYWEFGNEPDVDPDLLSDPHSPYGCWGDNRDPYYGGGYYATMLHAVHPVVKSTNPNAQVLVGGLLMDCDPNDPPRGENCLPSKFFEGILRNGGAASFDIVAFHAYGYYDGGISEIPTKWGARGGVLLGKVNFLREVMARYGVSKPILLSETALVCPEWMESQCSSNQFIEKQADYVTWAYVRSWAAGLLGVIWYTLEDPGWRYSGLYLSGQPKPAYYAYQFTARQLDGAVYAGPVLTDYPYLSAYEFRAPGKRIWVVWSADQIDHPIALPEETTRLMDKYGNAFTSSGGLITVNSPIYIELTP